MKQFNQQTPPLMLKRIASPLGELSLVAGAQGLRGIYFSQHRHRPPSDHWQEQPAEPLLIETERQLQAYFSRRLQQFDLPLDLSGGTPFQQKVWQALALIPYGTTWSYLELASLLQQPAAVRAVGAANGRNPFSIVLPCHRVIASSGALTGYAGGLENKLALLNLEAGERQGLLIN